MTASIIFIFEIEYLDCKKQIKENLGYILGLDRSDNDLFEILFNSLDKEGLLKAGATIPTKTHIKIEKKYFNEIEIFGDKIVQLINIRHNLHSMSGRFFQHVLYLAPQFGEYQKHQIILEKFCEINKSYIINEEF